MAEDWHEGDLALCVRTGRHEFGHEHPCRVGGIYTVERIVFTPDGTCGLGFVGITFRDTRLNADIASNFRKIRPHTPDAEDRETIRLLKGAPAPVDYAIRLQICRALRPLLRLQLGEV